MMRAAAWLGVLSIALSSAPRAGDTPAEFLAGMAALGNGDYAEAYHRWIPMAEQGYAEAQYHVGWLYANGNGFAVDIQKALFWWQEAANQGHADAQFAVGLAYTTGEGMKKDLDQAVSWYLTAAHQGHQDARDILIRLNGDPKVDLLERHPEIARETWFGWLASVNGERINVRAGPGTNSRIVAKLEKGAQVRVIGQRANWLMVVLPAEAGQGEIAWIYQSLLSSASR
jgi:hypothetical protein